MKKIILILITILSLASIFYWFEIRPGQIRKECSNECSGIKEGLSQKLGFSCYEECLHKRGLVK